MTRTTIDSVAIVGAGTIGASWAAFYLAKGMRVAVCDPAPSTTAHVQNYVASVWPQLAPTEPLEEAMAARLSFCDIAGLQGRGIDLVQENGPENLKAKVSIYIALEAVLSEEAIIASSTSGLPISDIQGACRTPGRCIVAHPFNPPHIMPLVELSAGPLTEAETVERCTAIYTGLGKSVVTLTKEIPGHIANRLQFALFREAVNLLLEGVASAADIDRAVTDGPGLRWAAMGPFQIFDLGGGAGGLAHFLDHLGDPIQSWWDDLGSPSLTAEVRREIVASVAGSAPDLDMPSPRARDMQLARLIEARSKVGDV